MSWKGLIGRTTHMIRSQRVSGKTKRASLSLFVFETSQVYFAYKRVFNVIEQETHFNDQTDHEIYNYFTFYNISFCYQFNAILWLE